MKGAPNRAITETAKTELVIEPGDVLAGKYRVEAEIGSGGMGVVLAARHVAMGHRLAIKVLRLHEEKNPRAAVARFVREARAAARIQSEHVVRVTDVAALPGGTPYMVMEYLEGEDLKHLLETRHQLPIEEAVGYVLQACEGLAEAHANGVVHRDLKPSNLFLTRRGNGTSVIKILDFGISKVAPREGEAAITTTDALMGSPLYMSPEQMRSAKNVDARTDVWAMGLILFELLAGEAPFGGDSIPEVCMAVMGAPPLAMTHFRQDVPNELQVILLKCMEKQREDRYATMGELARALERFAGEHSRTHADRASAAVRSVREAMPTDPEQEPEVSSLKKGRASKPEEPTLEAGQSDALPSVLFDGVEVRKPRRRAAWVALGAVVCVAAATGGALIARRPSPEPLLSPRAANVATAPATTTTSPPDTRSVELVSVPVDSLPLATRDAGSPRAARPVARAPAASTTSAVPSAPASKKEDWQWGDRN